MKLNLIIACTLFYTMSVLLPMNSFGQNADGENCQALIDFINEGCDSIHNEHCARILQLLRHDIEDCPSTSREVEESSGIRSNVAGRTKLAPVTNGTSYGYNISIVYDKTSEKAMFKIIHLDNEVEDVAKVDLTSNTVEIEFVSKNEFTVKKYSGDWASKWKNKKSMSPIQSFDAKIVPEFEGGTIPTFVGINDARDYKTTGSTGITVELNAYPFPTGQKLRIHQPSALVLTFSGSPTTKLPKPEIIDHCKIGEMMWGEELNVDKSKVCK